MHPHQSRFCLLLAALLLLAVSAFAAEARPPDIDRIRRELDNINRRVVQEYINEQATDAERSLVALVVGGMYESGKMGDSDPVRAADFYRQAAALGSPEAQFALGMIYNHGIKTVSGEIKRDPVKARGYFETAAAGGVPMAMLELGKIYEDGMNVDPDPKKALSYFMDAAARGEHEAVKRLEPIMLRAKEWEAEKPGRKANFPTTQDDLISRKLVEERIDIEFNMEKQASRIFVEVSKRIAAAAKNMK